MRPNGDSDPLGGQPSSRSSRDTVTASYNSDPKFAVTQTGASRLSRLNPKTWTRKTKMIALAALTLTIVALIPALAVPLALQAHNHTAAPATPLPVNTTSLRIMPLGASITYGWLSTDGNGYRQDLLDLLASAGVTDVTYVGSRHNGTMANNAVEGWPGLRIDQVLTKARASVPAYLPNVILLNVGTNDCVQNFDMDATTRTSPVEPELTANASYTVGSRMRIMVEDLVGWSPNATVVMSTLINNLNYKTQARVIDANKKFRAVAKELQAEGKRVVLAEMDNAAGGPTKATMADVTHPNDAGYSLMAKRWYAALKEAGEKGFINQKL